MEEGMNRISPSLYDKISKYLTFGFDTLWVARLTDEVEVGERARVLDIATGTGNVAIAVARRYKHYKVIALDFDSEMIKRAKKKSREIKNIEYIVGNAEATTLPSNSFDVITCSFGLGNFDQPGKALVEMYRMLEPGGKIVLLQMNRLRSGFIKRFYNLYYNVNILPMLDSRSRKSVERYVEMHPTEFDKRDVVRLLESTGFVNVKVINLTLNLAFIVTARKPAD